MTSLTGPTAELATPEGAALLTHHRAAPTGPDGCRWCGIGPREHASRFASPVGQHVYQAPTTAQRLARMKARREVTALTCADGRTARPRKHAHSCL